MGMGTGTASTSVWLMASSSDDVAASGKVLIAVVCSLCRQVFGLGFAATCFALYTWLPSKSKGTAEQLVVQRARLPFPSDEGQSALRQVDGKSEEAQEA